MKQKIFSICSLLSISASALLLAGCAEEFENGYSVEKPAEVTQTEQLAQYAPLKSYIDASNFRLGNTLQSSVFDEMGVAASMTLSNFNEVSIPNLFVHNSLVDAEGNVNTLAASTMAKTADERGIAIFAPALCPSYNVNTTYLEDLIKPVIVEEEAKTGTDVFDFEDYDLGATFPLQKATGEEGRGNVVVENDPAGVSGHVIHVSKTNQSFPAITLKFPEGRKLGDYHELHIDFYAKNATSRNQTLFFSMGGKNAEYKKAADFGCLLNTWGRGAIVIDLDAMSYSDSQKEQTEVTMVFGPKLMNCEYYIDNISLSYSYNPTYEVEKTPEEKHQIIGGELNKYITAVMTACPTIPAWVVSDGPVSAPATQIWKQNMGATYFIEAAAMMRQQAPTAKLFVTEYVTDATVRSQLLSLLAANSNQIDGFDVPVTIDATSFDASEFAAMLADLAGTGKLVRLNIQAFKGQSDADAGTALAQAVAAFKAQVPAAQRYGISFAEANESSSNAGLWTQGYNRKPTYAAFVNALQSK